MNKITHKLILLLALLLVPVLLEAADIQADLNGFRLLQLKNVAENYFGKPVDTFKTNASNVEAYRIDSNAYMVFEYNKNLPNNIFSIQLTGHTTKALPFKGLILGDDVQKVNAILGKPASVEKIESPNVSKYSYEGTNYTIEVDDKGKLFSIRIYSTKDFVQKADDTFKSYERFKALVIAKDIREISEMLRPDVEIYKNGEVLSIKQRYYDFITNPDKNIITALLGDTDSVIKEMKESEPEGELRLIKDFGVGEVYKFYKGKILKEIVFFPYNGNCRVYEITFREK